MVQAPADRARIIRTATLEQSVRGFVEAGEARGERHARDPAARDPAEHRLADRGRRGLRFTYSIILVASVNFFGLGLQPPRPTGR